MRLISAPSQPGAETLNSASAVAPPGKAIPTTAAKYATLLKYAVKSTAIGFGKHQPIQVRCKPKILGEGKFQLTLLQI